MTDFPALRLTEQPRFEKALNGWGRGYPTPEIVAWADARRLWGDEHKPNEMPNFAPPEQRRQGFVAEGLFNAWLVRRGVDFEHHGGTDGLPDFEVEGCPVALRCAAVKGYEFQKWMIVYIFEEHLEHSKADRFFLGYEGPTDSYVFLGGISYDDFIEEADEWKKGEQPCRNFTAMADMRTVEIDRLTRPRSWVQELRSGPDGPP